MGLVLWKWKPAIDVLMTPEPFWRQITASFGAKTHTHDTSLASRNLSASSLRECSITSHGMQFGGVYGEKRELSHNGTSSLEIWPNDRYSHL